jgi:hypothetical protein
MVSKLWLLETDILGICQARIEEMNASALERIGV